MTQPVSLSPSRDTTASPTSALPCLPRGLLCRRLVLGRLEGLTGARLDVILPEGERRSFGPVDASQRITMRIHRDRFFNRILFFGEIGFGEAYMDGDWDTDDLPGLLSLLIQHATHRPKPGFLARLSFDALRTANRWRHYLRDNTRANSRRNIKAHYDLSNDFYALWLDPSLTYSSAYYEHPTQSLAAAQEAKYRRLAQHLALQPGQRVLEIGCGWGGFALYAARHHGVHVTGLTVSEAQYRLARQRVAEAGLEGQIDIRLQDYRDVEGQFDAIASIEMLEAVGHRHLPTYFAQCERLLTPQGVLGLQVILGPDARYETGRKSADWIKKHIFPGGQLPSLTAINHALLRAGELTLQHFESFGLHYARTLREWRQRFHEQFDRVQELGFDETFRRKWHYYLAVCEAAFQSRNINVAHLVYTRPNNPRFHLPGERASVV